MPRTLKRYANNGSYTVSQDTATVKKVNPLETINNWKKEKQITANKEYKDFKDSINLSKEKFNKMTEENRINEELMKKYNLPR